MDKKGFTAYLESKGNTVENIHYNIRFIEKFLQK